MRWLEATISLNVSAILPARPVQSRGRRTEKSPSRTACSARSSFCRSNSGSGRTLLASLLRPFWRAPLRRSAWEDLRTLSWASIGRNSATTPVEMCCCVDFQIRARSGCFPLTGLSRGPVCRALIVCPGWLPVLRANISEGFRGAKDHYCVSAAREHWRTLGRWKKFPMPRRKSAVVEEIAATRTVPTIWKTGRARTEPPR